MSEHTYGEIPDDVVTKRFVPLAENLYSIFKELGWDYFYDEFTAKGTEFFEKVPDFLSDKFQRAVTTAKKVIDGSIPDPENFFTTFFFPPVLYVRTDLQMGGTKLIYGNSTDITFIVMNDMNYELELLINAHMEDGIPVDYWFIKKGDEVFDRRHMKLGYKLSEIPEKSKDFLKSGLRIMDILKDVRNERSPQWADSAYSMAMNWAGGSTNMFLEFSSYNVLGQLWDGVNAKKQYGMPDMYFGYIPYPPILKMLLSMGRPEFMIRIEGLLSHNRLFIHAFEPEHYEYMKFISPEALDWCIRKLKEQGVPTPRQSLGCKVPNLKDKKTFKKEEFDFIYPEGPRIMPFEWGLTDEEAFYGIHTDITHETPSEPVYGKEHVVSIGVGKKITI